MKKGIVITIIAITGLLLWAPWMAEEGGEDTIRATIQLPVVRTELDALTAKYSCAATNMSDNCCDGISSSWAPFGRKVEYCEHGSWYVPFWGN